MTDPFALLASMPETPPIPMPGALPPGSRLVLRTNPLFVGRTEEMRTLVLLFKGTANRPGAKVVSVEGLGGIGKTQLASEFALRYGRYFAGGVFWLSFADAANVPTEVAACGSAEAMNLRPSFTNLSQAEQIALVRAEWNEQLPRLLIFDNCEEERLLEMWLPRLDSGSRVLLTSRRTIWAGYLSPQSFVLHKFPRSDSLILLARFRPDLEGNRTLPLIAHTLGDLPLALHLAGSYLKRYRYSPSLGDPDAYLRDLQNPDLLTHPSMQGHMIGESPTKYDPHVARTFAINRDRLAASDAFVDHLALALLARAALFAPGEPIPRALLLATLERPDNREIRLENEDALLRLIELGLAEQDAEGALTLAPLLAHFAHERHYLPLRTAIELAVINKANLMNRADHPAVFQLLPHLHHLTKNSERIDKQGASLVNELGNVLSKQGNDIAARPLLERALALRENILGSNHPDTAQSLNNLGVLLYRQGDYTAARAYYERALSIHQEVLGSSHPDTAQSLTNLGVLLYRQGDYTAARAYYERALAIYEEVLEPDHPNTARSLSNLGLLLRRQGEYAAARPYLERALAIWEKELGPQHPATANSLNNLGDLLSKQGEYTTARPYFERALTILEKTLGPSHPHTRKVRGNLAGLDD